MLRRTFGAAAATLALALTLSACSGGGSVGGGGSTHDDTLKIGTMTAPTSLDPKDAVGSAMPYFQATYDTLIKREPNGDFAPMLATKWSYDSTMTKLSLTLREGVKFDDGSAFDAKAVKENLDRFRDGGGGSASLVKGLTVDVVDASHVDLNLAKADPGMLFYLSDAAGLMANPAKFASKDGLVTTPDGTGPYTFDSSKSAIGTSWVFEKRKNYWGDAAKFSTLTISAFDNENAIANGLKTGQLDTALLQTADQQLAIKSDSNLKTQDIQFDFQGLLLFDRGGAVTPALKDVKVRQALNYALDRKTLLSVVRSGAGTETSQVWGTDTKGYDKALDSAYPFDPAKAKTLLSEAGYPNGFELKLPRMTAIVTDNIASAIQANYAAVGVKVTWVDVEAASALNQIFRQKQFPAMVMNMGQSSNDWIVYNALIAPGTFNFFGTMDPDINKLAAEARVLPADKSADLYKQMNKEVVDKAWFVPFYRMTYQLVTVPGITALPQSGMAVPSIYNYSLTAK